MHPPWVATPERSSDRLFDMPNVSAGAPYWCWPGPTRTNVTLSATWQSLYRGDDAEHFASKPASRNMYRAVCAGCAFGFSLSLTSTVISASSSAMSADVIDIHCSSEVEIGVS